MQQGGKKKPKIPKKQSGSEKEESNQECSAASNAGESSNTISIAEHTTPIKMRNGIRLVIKAKNDQFFSSELVSPPNNGPAGQEPCLSSGGASPGSVVLPLSNNQHQGDEVPFLFYFIFNNE